MFSSLRDKGKDPQGQVPCGGHFRSRQNLPEHGHGWLGSKWLWVVFVFVVYVILKFRGDSEKSKVRMVRIDPFCFGGFGGVFFTHLMLSQKSQTWRNRYSSYYRQDHYKELGCLLVLRNAARFLS